MDAAVDLYSDTQTRPTDAMRKVMHDAEVGDEQSFLDPSVAALCDQVAEWFGQDAALFLPTGTMCNLVAVATHTSPGDAIVLDRQGHIARSETGGAAAVNGVVTDLLDGDRGRFTAEQLVAALEPGSRYRPAPRLVCVEQTHNFAGGTVWPLDQYLAVVGTAHDHGIPVHVDGARVANAVVASGRPAKAWGAPVDSIWVDFTKGLGAPLGAVLAGPADFIEQAWLYKHRFGGAMRQAGVAAAACSYALVNHVERLADDHERAARLGGALAELGLAVEPVETNMVFFDPSPRGVDATTLVTRLVDEGVRCAAVGSRVRLVTHLDVDDRAIDHAITAFSTIFASPTRRN